MKAAVNSALHNSWCRKRRNSSQSGYASLAVVLVLFVVVVSVGTTVAQTSITDLQEAFSHKRGEVARLFVEACVEEAVLQYNETGTLPTQVTLLNESCSVTILTQTQNSAIFQAEITVDGYTKHAEVSVDRSTSITITNWSES